MASQPTLKSCLKKRSKSVYEPMLTVSFNKSPSARNVRFEPMVYQHSYSETRVNDDKNTRAKITPKKRNREVELLIEAQMNWKPIDTYYIDDQPKVVTRSARKRRFTIDTFHSHEESPPSSKTSRSSQKQKPKPAPQKKPGAKKSRAKQPRNNLENAFAQLRDGVNKMSKASRNYTKTEFYDISSFPECALFLKVNDETTFCKMAFNTGIAYMDVGAVRAWTFHDAGVIAVSLKCPLKCYLWS